MADKKRGRIENLIPFKKGGDDRQNKKGRPRKLPELDKLLDKVLGGEIEMEAILTAMYKRALKGDIRAAELLLERGYGKVKQSVDSKIVAETKIIVTYDGGINNLIAPNSSSETTPESGIYFTE